jgi:nucleoside-diphosphate-sugar epimerase
MKVGRTKGQVINVACGGQISVNQVIAAINKVLGKNVRPNHVDRRPGDVRHSCAAVGLAKELLGYEPTVDFEEGLRRAIEYYKTLV